MSDEREGLVKRLTKDEIEVLRGHLMSEEGPGFAFTPYAYEQNFNALCDQAIAALSAQPQGEPVAWMYVTRYANKFLSFRRIPDSARHDYYAEYALIFKERSSYAKIFDDIHGTPCEQIRWQQKIEELECKLSEEKEITQRLALELDGYRKAEADINNALNSGNGTYSP